MRNLDADGRALLQQVGRQYSQLVELMDTLRVAELEFMATSTTENFCTSKGRVQVLTELRQLLRPTP